MGGVKCTPAIKKLLKLSDSARKRSRTVSLSDDDDFVVSHNKRLKRQPQQTKPVTTIVPKTRSKLVNNVVQVPVGTEADHEFDYQHKYAVSVVTHNSVIDRKQTKHGQGYTDVGEHLLSLEQPFPGGNRHSVVKVGCSSEFTLSDAVNYDSVNKSWAVDFALKNLFQDNGLTFIPQHRTLFQVSLMHKVSVEQPGLFEDAVKNMVKSLAKPDFPAVVKYNGNGSLVECLRINKHGKPE